MPTHENDPLWDMTDRLDALMEEHKKRFGKPVVTGMRGDALMIELIEAALRTGIPVKPKNGCCDP